jgi:hypothetical protein
VLALFVHHVVRDTPRPTGADPARENPSLRMHCEHENIHTWSNGRDSNPISDHLSPLIRETTLTGGSRTHDRSLSTNSLLKATGYHDPLIHRGATPMVLYQGATSTQNVYPCPVCDNNLLLHNPGLTFTARDVKHYCLPNLSLKGEPSRA